MDLNPPPHPAPMGVDAVASVRVIVIDSHPEVRGRLRAFLVAAGASVLEVSDVDEAIDLADRGEAGLVLCGISDDSVALRALAAGRMSRHESAPWALVALVPEAVGLLQVDELQGLADDFLQLPLSVGWLGARLRLYARMGSYVARTQAQRKALKRHQDEAEEEQRIASYLISRLEGRDPIADRMMHAWVSPAHHLSGDVVAVARSPDDRINVLLADGTGHGLAAAISVLPVSEVFHRMTDRGFDIASIVTEMNRKLRSCMPADRFVACVAASIDMRERVIELWNGGCPPVMLLGSDGSLERVWRSRHMALGILDGRDFDSSVERCSYREQSQLMVVSDGLSEALGQDGKHRFGDRELLEAVRGPSAQRLERVVSCLHDFTGNSTLEDDASILLVDCLLEPLPDPVVEARLRRWRRHRHRAGRAARIGPSRCGSGRPSCAGSRWYRSSAGWWSSWAFPAGCAATCSASCRNCSATPSTMACWAWTRRCWSRTMGESASGRTGRKGWLRLRPEASGSRLPSNRSAMASTSRWR